MITAIVLAAGMSRRMPGANKLLLPFRGAPLVTRAVSVALASKAEEVVVVIGFEAERIREELSDLPVHCIVNDRYAEGLTTSIQSGVRAAAPESRAYMVCLADMPLLTSEDLDRLIGVFELRLEKDPKAIVRAAWEDVPGHPVILAAAHCTALLRHSEPDGCRSLLQSNDAHVTSVPLVRGIKDVDDAVDLMRIGRGA